MAIYPYVLFLVFFPFYVFDFSHISHSDALRIIYSERVKLNIEQKAVINLVLSDKRESHVTWDNLDGPFTIKVYKNDIKEEIIRHELFHIKRIQDAGARGMSHSFVAFIRYTYIEEPLAIIYGYLGIKLG